MIPSILCTLTGATPVPKVQQIMTHSKAVNLLERISPVNVLRKFPDDAAVEAWIVQQRLSAGIRCDRANVQVAVKHTSMAYRCRPCWTIFSSRMGPVMQGSDLGVQVRVIATSLLSTGIKGTSSMKLHRNVDIPQKKMAGSLAHCIRRNLA